MNTNLEFFETLVSPIAEEAYLNNNLLLTNSKIDIAPVERDRHLDRRDRPAEKLLNTVEQKADNYSAIESRSSKRSLVQKMSIYGNPSFSEQVVLNNSPIVEEVASTSVDTKQALLIVGSQQLDTTEQAIKERLEEKGFQVTIADDDSTSSSNATDQDLVLISQSVSSNKINTQFTNVSVPVITWEAYLYDDLKLTGSTIGEDFGVLLDTEEITIAQSSHPLAANLSGTIPVYEIGDRIGWGKPNENAIEIAHLRNNSERSTLFAYQKGAELVGGQDAPERRVGFWLNSTLSSDQLTTEGWQLFDAAVDWATTESSSIYVAPNGSDNNLGTFEQPFKTIQHALKQLDDGGTIYLRGGTYSLDESIAIYGDKSGTADTPLTIRSYDGERAILDGSGLAQGAVGIFMKDIEHVDIVGLELHSINSHAIEVINGHHINILDNLIRDTKGMGIRVRGYLSEIPNEGDTTQRSSDIRIEGNEVYRTNLHNSGTNKGKNIWGSAVQVMNVDRIAIANNEVYENYGEGIALILATNSTATNNTVYDNFSVQMYLDNASNSTLERNFIYNTGNPEFLRNGLQANGIGLGNEIYNVEDPSDYYLNNNLIHQNVIVGGNAGLYYGIYAGLHHNGNNESGRGINNTLIARNTFYEPELVTVGIEEDPNINNVNFTDNIFVQTNSQWMTYLPSTEGLNFQRNLWYNADIGAAESTDDVEADPLFVNPGGNEVADYQLRSGSSAINAGGAITGLDNTVTDDKPDLGALEYGETPFVTGI